MRGPLYHFSDFLRHADWRMTLITVEIFPRQWVTIEMLKTWVVSTDKLFHPFNWFVNAYSGFLKGKKYDLTAPPVVALPFDGLSVYGITVMSNSCHLLSPLFLFLYLSQIATNFTFTPDRSVMLHLLNLLPSNATKNYLRNLWNTN